MNDDLLDSMLIKPLPKKHDTIKHTFLFPQNTSEEEFLDSKLSDKTDSFSKKEYNDFIGKLAKQSQFIDKTKEDLLKEHETKEDETKEDVTKESIKKIESQGYEEFKKNDTITEIKLKDPLEKIFITKEEQQQPESIAKKSDSRITEKPKTLKPKDYSIDNEFIID